MIRRLAAPGLALLALVFFCALWVLRDSSGRISGDEATYRAMAESLALDLDLRFDAADRERLTAAGDFGRASVILQRDGSGVAYSKPILYPLIGAPFYRLLGQRGLLVLNALSLAAALVLLGRWLRSLGGADPWLTLATFAATATLVTYVSWETSDLFQAALAIAGLALTLDGVRDPGGARDGAASPGRASGRRLAGGLLLGILVSLRVTNGLIAAIPVVALSAGRRFGSAAVVGAAIAGTVLLGAGATTLLTGSPSPYRAVRATFNPETGYPIGPAAEAALARFDFDRATYDSKKRLIEPPLASAYSGVYFLVGRYTGLLAYFPLAFVLVGAALRRPDKLSWSVLAAVGALSFFYLVYLPFNYFGGAACVGNRYFLVSYAALPFALRRPLRPAPLFAVWILASVTAVSALFSVASTRDRDPSLLNHAHAGLFRLLPAESTAAALAGGTDVFWNKEFARFPDPYARVSRWRFVLGSQEPPAEMSVANRRADDRLRLLVLSSAPELELVYSDWGKRIRVPLERPLGKRGLVEIEPSRPLRYHPLWFRNVWDHGLPYYVRVFRLAVRAPGNAAAEAEVRYLGLEPWPDDAFSRQVIEVSVPGEAIAGARGSVGLRVRNTSGRAWSSEGVFPVYLSYRLTLVDGSRPAAEGARTTIGVVPAGTDLARSVSVDWPPDAGSYLLSVDLLIEGVSWFAERVGEPLVEAQVRVVSPGASGEILGASAR